MFSLGQRYEQNSHLQIIFKIFLLFKIMCIFVAEQKQKEMKELTKEQMEIVKREHPEWFNEVEVGKWYNLNRGKCLMFVTELISHKEAIGYGFGYTGAWREDGTRWDIKGAAEATPEEVKSALIAEAKRRYKVGDKLSNVFDDFNLWERVFSENLHFRKSDYSLWTLYDGGTYYNSCISCIFKDGKWATVVAPENDIHADIKALKDKYPNYNWTIIAEEKQ